MDPARSATLYALTGRGLLKSTDAGDSWTTIRLETPPIDLAIDPSNTDTLYATGGEECWCEEFISHLYRSTDAGATWSKVSDGLFGYIVVDRSDPAVLYSYGLGAVKKSTDGGLTWNDTNLRTVSISNLIIDPTRSSTLFAATGRGVFKSTDAGVSWIPTGSN